MSKFEILSKAIPAMIVLLVFARIRKRQSVRLTLDSDTPTTQVHRDIPKGYLVSQLGAFLLIPTLTPILCFAIYFGLVNLYEYRLSFIDGSVFLIPFDSSIWVLVSLFASILSVWIPIHYIFMYILGKERYLEYTEYAQLGFGSLASKKPLFYMAAVIAPLCVVTTISSFNTYARITEDAFYVNSHFT